MGQVLRREFMAACLDRCQQPEINPLVQSCSSHMAEWSSAEVFTLEDATQPVTRILHQYRDCLPINWLLQPPARRSKVDSGVLDLCDELTYCMLSGWTMASDVLC